MTVRKVTISLPADVLDRADRVAESRGESRSGYIAFLLDQAGGLTRDADIKRRINAVFADPEIREDQLQTAKWAARGRSGRGSEW